jgi:putative oxidoreductase
MNSTIYQGWVPLIGRLIVAGVFGMAVFFKFSGIVSTAAYITAAGIPFALPLAWAAAIFETLLVISFVTGIYFRQAALLAVPYILFLAFAFHGPSHFAANGDEFGFFVDHFTFAAALLFMAANGPGKWASRQGNTVKDVISA